MFCNKSSTSLGHLHFYLAYAMRPEFAGADLRVCHKAPVPAFIQMRRHLSSLCVLSAASEAGGKKIAPDVFRGGCMAYANKIVGIRGSARNQSFYRWVSLTLPYGQKSND